MPEQGPLSIGVPGMVRGYRDLLANHGSRTFEELVQPALGYAANGHPIAFDLSDHLAADVELLSSFPSSKAVLLPGGKPPARGNWSGKRTWRRPSSG